MQPVKLGGLTLKSEEKKEDVIRFSGEDTPGPSLKVREELRLIIKRVEDFPKDNNTIKAIGKLKGALQLLS